MNSNESTEQPLKSSKYNINNAFDFDITSYSSLIVDSCSIHPLQTTDEAYAIDISRTSPKQKEGQLSAMMSNLSLTKTDSTDKDKPMPYCL
ncbi:hypothetical protein A0J61_06603 [Choanephora cucurbitarum]|uniref:Uncharacterized protein n=1 Tax=Choanephora cucurbitarum TaxID=101091 RepID=A0A1C7N8A3_9FUNG|nr:hypothetical protein A0J61_06603 [Choanephora cucurbitarum]